MTMNYTDEEAMLQESTAAFLQAQAPIAQMRRLRDTGSETGFDPSTWAAMVEMGWAGILIDEAHGGVGLNIAAACVVMEEMGRTLTVSPFLSSSLLATTALAAGGTDDQKARWLPKLASGEALLTVAIDEGARHAPDDISTTATRSGNGFVIAGEKSFVLDAPSADHQLVLARFEGQSRFFLVPRSAPGVEMSPRAMVDSRPVGRVVYANVAVDGDAMLAGDAASTLASVLGVGRLALAAEMTGGARECLHRTVGYLREREQFGQKIGSFQALQHRASHLYTEVELARALTRRAALAVGASDAGALTAAAKAKAGQVAILAAQEAIQMHGGIGMTDEYDIGFFLKRVRVADATFGDTHFQLDAFARLRGY